MIRRMIKSHLRFILRWHARFPFLAPPILCVVFSLPVVFAGLLGDLIGEVAGAGLFGLEYFPLVLFLFIFAPSVFSAFGLYIEELWTICGLYGVFGIKPSNTRDAIRHWADFKNEGTKA
jgi:hypothetical protein